MHIGKLCKHKSVLTHGKTKFQIEFDLKSIPPALLWTYISSPSGLKEWFADEVTLHGKRFTFRWDDGAEQTAAIVAQRTESSLRLRWHGDSLRHYFEFKILSGEMTDSTFAPCHRLCSLTS